ncbi:MAG: hypothetical protein Q8O84_02590 [Nanoarchaeota archaeon]|nr:hypothetical protein [Nanoarchaeota archaeon]
MKIEAKIKISLSAIIILCLVFIVFLIWPLLKDIKKSSSDISEQKQKLLLLESKSKNLEKFQNRYVDIEPTEAFFVKADLPVDFIRFLERTSKDSDITAKISLSSGTYQIAVAGSFPNFLRFLERLQNSQYLIEIGNFNVARQGQGNINANLSLNVLSK